MFIFYNNKLKRTKILIGIMLINIISLYTLTPNIALASAFPMTSDTNQILYSLFGNNKISNYVSYNYTKPSDINNVYVMCKATGGKNSKKPIVGKEAKYQCMVQASNSILPQPIQTKTITPTESGEKTIDFNFAAQVEQPTVNKETETINTTNENIIVTLTLEVGDTATTIESGSDAMDATISTVTNNNTDSNSGTNTSTSSTSKCSDGSDWCPEDATGLSNTSTVTTDANGNVINNGSSSGSNTGTDGTNGTNGTNGTGTDGTNGTNGTNGTSSSGTSYKDLLDDLLDDNNGSSYNSGDRDWANSGTGDSGTGDLDNYFMGTENDSNSPDGISTDVLGVGDNGNDIVPDTTTQNNNDSSDSNNTPVEYNNDEPNNDDGYSNDNNQTNGNNSNNSSLPLQDLAGKFQEGVAGMDGLTGDNNGLLGNINSDKNTSLSQKMKELLGDNSIAGNKKGTATDQELFDIAKKLLLAAGFSINDIEKGKNYDANSAYTEPGSAWDMNRITTLLHGKKIQLTSPTETKTTNNTNSVSNSAKVNKK